MRAGPVGVYPDIKRVIDFSTRQAKLTHNTAEGIHAAVAASLMLHYFLSLFLVKNCLSPPGKIRYIQTFNLQYFIRFAEKYSVVEKESQYIFYLVEVKQIELYGFCFELYRTTMFFYITWEKKKSSPSFSAGRGWMSVRAAITSLINNNSLSEILKSSISWGGDTDTVVTIALAAASCSKTFKQDLPENLYKRTGEWELWQRLPYPAGQKTVGKSESVESLSKVSYENHKI